MKKAFLNSLISIFLLSFISAGCGNKKQPEQAPVEPKTEDLVSRGEYLVTIMGCHDCHSPKTADFKPIPGKLLSGFPADRKPLAVSSKFIKQGWIIFNEDLTSTAGPWGISFSANLSSDQTGTGNWTEENLRLALKQGKYKGLANSRTLLPPMPWPNFANLAEEELKAIFAYLKSTAPVSNVVPPPVTPDQVK